MDSEADDYELSGSEQEYDEEEREILNDLRKERQKRADKLKNEKKDVLSFSESDDDDEDEDVVGNLMRDSDIEGAEDDDGDLPDTMDWGTNKKAYYNTDFVDPDYSSYTAQEEDMAKAEEEEAKKIQLRLVKQLTEADFKLDDMTSPAEIEEDDNDNATKSIAVPRDLKGLTEREQLQLLQKDSPEFLGLIQDFRQQLKEVEELTAPVLAYVRKNDVPMVPALQFAQVYQNVLLTHCNNVSFYLLLKARRSNIKHHPVVKRLVQLKKLRDQLMPRYEKIIRPQLVALLERIQNGDEFIVLDPTQRKSKLKILNQFNKKQSKKGSDDDDSEDNDEADEDEDDEDGDDNDTDDDEQLKQLERLDEEEIERRGITYQMAKNKGLTPHRKKELRNPRVKHRGKYRKALIRRKGAVRTVRKEIKRYGGEASGIKATVTKSVKFKT